MDVLIAGGGIAGLTMALTCHEIGVPVRVFEDALRIRPLGVGINLQPGAVRELVDLGLGADLADIAVETRELAVFGPDGSNVWSTPRGRDAGYRWPQYSVHRGELEMLLYRAAIDRLGPAAIMTGHRVTGYEHGRDGGVCVRCTMRDGASERIDGSLLLGADGLHSAVRSQMFPGDGGPRWGGSVLWRGASSSAPLQTGASFIVVGDPTQRFVVFPISAPDPSTGLQLQSWIAELAFEANRGWRRGDWNTQVAVDEFVGAFEGWTFDWLDVPDLIRRADHVFEYPMVDRDPVDHWVHGSVALIGDAAHAMYPVGSNGASQAIVDARVVGAKLAQHGVGREALHAYEAQLLGSRSALVLRNRRLGPGSILGVADADFDKDFGDVATMSPHELTRFTADYHTVSTAAVNRLNTSTATITRVS